MVVISKEHTALGHYTYINWRITISITQLNVYIISHWHINRINFKNGCYGLNHDPSKFILFKSQPPRTSECNVYLVTVPHLGNQVKMTSLRWALTQYDWCSYRKGKLQHIQEGESQL